MQEVGWRLLGFSSLEGQKPKQPENKGKVRELSVVRGATEENYWSDKTDMIMIDRGWTCQSQQLLTLLCYCREKQLTSAGHHSWPSILLSA